MCTVTCPKGLNPQESLHQLFEKVKELRKKKIDEEVL
jgi:succinate dehydrogenase/fumarate reductase-like Fe-S protein